MSYEMKIYDIFKGVVKVVGYVGGCGIKCEEIVVVLDCMGVKSKKGELVIKGVVSYWMEGCWEFDFNIFVVFCDLFGIYVFLLFVNGNWIQVSFYGDDDVLCGVIIECELCIGEFERELEEIKCIVSGNKMGDEKVNVVVVE